MSHLTGVYVIYGVVTPEDIHHIICLTDYVTSYRGICISWGQELQNTINVRNVVFRNVRYGMAEKFEINRIIPLWPHQK